MHQTIWADNVDALGESRAVSSKNYMLRSHDNQNHPLTKARNPFLPPSAWGLIISRSLPLPRAEIARVLSSRFHLGNKQISPRSRTVLEQSGHRRELSILTPVPARRNAMPGFSRPAQHDSTPDSLSVLTVFRHRLMSVHSQGDRRRRQMDWSISTTTA